MCSLLGQIPNETTKMMKGMAYKDILKKEICTTLACQKLKRKHYGLQIFETCKFEEKEFFVYKMV